VIERFRKLEMKPRHVAAPALRRFLKTAKALLVAIVLAPGLFRRFKYKHVAQEKENHEVVKRELPPESIQSLHFPKSDH